LKRPTKQALKASREAAIQAFTPGQRWLSETQGELGLGLVAEVDERLVRLLFPATGEERAYARHNAPYGGRCSASATISATSTGPSWRSPRLMTKTA
jgi:hypothetical protein